MNFSIKLIILFLGISIMACENESKSSRAKSPENNSSESYKPSIQTSVGIVIPEKTVSRNEEVCLDVKVKDFNKIVSMQHSVNWDPKTLKFTKLQGYNLTGLSEANFGITQSANGNFGVSWYDPSLAGVSLETGSKIYEICFEAIGAGGASSPVRISSDPVAVEVSTSEERLLDIPNGKGKVNIR